MVPCKNCITLGMCRGRLSKYKESFERHPYNEAINYDDISITKLRLNCILLSQFLDRRKHGKVGAIKNKIKFIKFHEKSWVSRTTGGKDVK